MAKDKLTEYSATNASNDVIGDISVAEGMLPSAVNNALREQMTHLKNFSDGTDAIDALAVDNLKLDGNTISSTDTNGNISLSPNGTGSVNLTDNAEIQMGAGADLKVSSDGTNGILRANNGRVYIQTDTGVNLTKTGNAETMLIATPDGSVDLYHNNSKKFETTSSGVTVSGDLLVDGADPELIIQDTNDTGDAFIKFKNNSGTQRSFIQTAMTADVMLFGTGTSERMRLTAGGNLNIGKTADGFGTAGLGLRGDANVAQFTRSGDSPLELNRLSNNGDLIGFYKDSSAVGSIGNASSSELYIDSGSGGTGLSFRGNHIRPRDNGSDVDNAVDLGNGSFRFDDIFATNGTINTSDQNEKQQIASLTAAEITAAKSISALFKTFKWNDKVEAKGNAARIHSGVIAQEVQTAMSNAGLDAANYAFWCSDTWWETSTNIPAVEAVDEVTDEDGNVTTEAVEAKDAYTRIDTYETADEAPDSATQRTRMGIRYPELLAFVCAATEQRLADIETRLTALEAD